VALRPSQQHSDCIQRSDRGCSERRPPMCCRSQRAVSQRRWGTVPGEPVLRCRRHHVPQCCQQLSLLSEPQGGRLHQRHWAARWPGTTSDTSAIADATPTWAAHPVPFHALCRRRDSALPRISKLLLRFSMLHGWQCLSLRYRYFPWVRLGQESRLHD
jgi:hypothetical protein